MSFFEFVETAIVGENYRPRFSLLYSPPLLCVVKVAASLSSPPFLSLSPPLSRSRHSCASVVRGGGGATFRFGGWQLDGLTKPPFSFSFSSRSASVVLEEERDLFSSPPATPRYAALSQTRVEFLLARDTVFPDSFQKGRRRERERERHENLSTFLPPPLSASPLGMEEEGRLLPPPSYGDRPSVRLIWKK